MTRDKIDKIINQVSSIYDESNLMKETVELIIELEAEINSLKRQLFDMAVELELLYKKDAK